MAKKYFWLKLKNDFFEQKEIKMLRRIAGGDTYTIIYLKMLLLSLSNEGKIYYDGIAENMVSEIALSIDEDEENVQVTFTYLLNKGLIVFGEDEDELELTNIASMIGSESDSARRMRKHRLKKMSQSDTLPSHSDKRVTAPLRGSDAEIEKEIDIEIDKEQQQGNSYIVDNYSKQGKETSMPPAAGQKAIDYFQDSFNIRVTPIMVQEIQHWAKETSEDLVILAFNRSIGTKNPYRFAKSILEDWAIKKIKTVEAANAEQAEFKKNHFKNFTNQATEVGQINPELGW
ncbi:phage replisome organizer N-terminal domain-containing protein [Aerococcus mictus]|uniref:phage replisome organizer N-terminal domain-containing protein n=1 Tax=Aerococcus mictus TaxID=2976810 RepID=UPI000DCD4676|nr:hypothetical protein DBT53_06950 [Aerococcus mictus]RAV94154.1 hypothetical protein DBT53_07185 [Aerococcus mictus]